MPLRHTIYTYMDGFGSSGVRGVAFDDITPQDALDIAQAAGSVLLEDSDRVAVGRDTRRTGDLLVSAVTSGLASVGCRVERVGIVPTPSLQSYCEREGISGVMVTASHNPPEYNGLKICGTDGVELPRDTLDRIEAKLSGGPELVSWEEAGTIRETDGINRAYIDELLSRVDRDRIEAADLSIALDPGHGAGALTSPEFFTELGCSVTTVNAQPDGNFPGRNPEPIADNLADLGNLVRSVDADLGIAHDGDADRAIFFDETGSFVEGDAALAALAANELEAGDMMVSAVNCSQRLVDVVDEIGADLQLTPIGSTNIISAIRDLQSAGASIPIAGEGNGGVIYPAHRIARDGAYTAARFCELIADTSVSELVAPYGGYANVRYNIPYETSAQRQAMIDAIEQAAAETTAEIDTTDGYRLDYGDAWVLARPSGTEPLVRVYAEAREQSRAEELASEMVDSITTIADA